MTNTNGLPYDPYTGRFGYCTGHVAGQQGGLYYVHPAGCPLHPQADGESR